MIEAILTFFRILILGVNILVHLVKFIWVSLTILPLTFIDSWIKSFFSPSNYLNGLWNHTFAVVYEGDSIYAMIKWMFSDD